MIAHGAVPSLLIHQEEGHNLIIPISDLGYNDSLGFFPLSAHPEVESRYPVATGVTIHEVAGAELLVASIDGQLVIIGQGWQAAALYNALGAYLTAGVSGQTLDEEEVEGTWIPHDEALAFMRKQVDHLTTAQGSFLDRLLEGQ